jgi:hypothetical protein
MELLFSRILAALFLGLIVLVSAVCFGSITTAEASEKEYANGLPLSDMEVKITSCGKTAVFRLYDTDAAKKFYSQLPFEKKLENFRDAQWMFYPPEKLPVKKHEAYHDGKKGELSYYEPWGDAFMLYEDFYAGDEMHRLGIGIKGIQNIVMMSDNARIEKYDENMQEEKSAMTITIKSNGNEIKFELNDSQAAKDLYKQLPLSIKVENYSSNEKIFYPPEKLNTSNTPLAKNVKPGTLAYYAPWADVVMFYGSFGSASGLYELGHAVSGADQIKKLSGSITIEK